MSTLLAVAILTVWLVVASYFTRRWHGVVPPLVKDLPDDERWGALQAFISLQANRNVNRWRRTIVASGAVLIILAWGIVEDERRDAQREEDACDNRTEGRSDVRSAIAADKDEFITVVAEEFGLTIEPAQRERIIERSAARVYAELPPPRC